MRLIDANAMYKRYCVDKEGLDGIYDATDLPDMLADMPTIYAIPVEWLKGLMLSGDDDVDKVEFAWIMREWQKEQEAR